MPGSEGTLPSDEENMRAGCPRFQDIPFAAGGIGATAYAETIGVYLGFAVDYAVNYGSVIATPAEGFFRGTFPDRRFQ